MTPDSPVLTVLVLGEAHWLKLPTWPGTIVTICVSCFMTGDPDKEYRTNKSPPTGRVQERSKGDTPCPSTSQTPLTSIHLGWAMHVPPGKTESEWLAKDHPETKPITIKPDIASHAAELFSWVPLPYCSPPGCPFPIKSLILSASGPITSWEIDGETGETVSDFIFWGLQNHCRWWLQPWN